MVQDSGLANKFSRKLEERCIWTLGAAKASIFDLRAISIPHLRGFVSSSGYK